MTQGNHFSGRARVRTTKKSVRIADILACLIISGGGIGTIIAVLGVCVFLVWVVVPLFSSAEVSAPKIFQSSWRDQEPLHVAMDEYQVMGWMLLPDGKIQVFRADNGQVLFEQQLFDEGLLTCSSFLLRRPEGVFGFSDGSIRMLNIGFETTFPDGADVSEDIRRELATKARGAPATMDEGIVQLTPEGQYRRQRLTIKNILSQKVSEAPIRLIDHVMRSSGPLICFLTGSESAYALEAICGEEKEDFLSGGKTFVFDAPTTLPMESLSRTEPGFLAISGTGRDVYVGWEDGALLRIHLRSMEDAFIAEKGRLVEEGVSLTALDFILGDTTLVWGDSKGRVRGGFPVRVQELTGRGLLDGVRNEERAQFAFAVSKDLADTGSAVRSLAPSGRTRIMLCGFEDGRILVVNVTSEGTLASLRVPSEEPVIALTVSPKEDGFLAVTPEETCHYQLDPMHPEADMASLFKPVWYEGYSKPIHMWQSSSGTDDFEPKLGLIPLIFGTIKTTMYAMLFGAPLALLAALYSSEFLHPRAKAAIKPTIELMAGLPSVVLGFLAALVFAPYVEKVVPACLTVMVTLPVVLLLGAYIWQLLPKNLTLRLANWRPLFMVVPAGFGVFLATVAGPAAEDLFFGGNIQDWLSFVPGSDPEQQERFGSALGGWLFIWIPLCALLVFLLMQRLVSPWLRRMASTLERRVVAWLSLAKFAATALVTLGLALLLAVICDRLGLDVRGDLMIGSINFSPFDTYVQRNAMIVGFVMGFAIIPIIYTIADDAFAAVPEHLRSASLGAGATPWQTAVRIVIPTAMSGLFSALMIGLGRAVGETMIVLMALGNTPIMDWNIFNGARTLSANIAVEIPEAVQNSTHYRTLFLAALVLFVMTFIVNTVAEIVRLRFRRRAYQL